MILKIKFLVLLLIFSNFFDLLWGDRVTQEKQIRKIISVRVGLILDVGSSKGKVVSSCINMAISDINGNHGKEIELFMKDSKGDPMSSLAAAVDLLENIKVQAIIVLEMTSEASIIASLCDKSNIPLLSFTSIPSPTAHPYYLQIKEDEINQFNAIIALLEDFNWKNIVMVHEETDEGRIVLQQLLEKFQENKIGVVFKSFDPLRVLDGQIVEEFQKLKIEQKSVFVVHTSPSLGARIFKNLKSLGMMSKGYFWLVTSETMDFLDSFDPLVIESMQGVLGVKSYIPSSRKLQNFTSRWKREIQFVHPDLYLEDFYVFGIRAYQSIWSLSKASQSLGTRVITNGSTLMNKLLDSKFTFLTGDYQFLNRKLAVTRYEVANVIGKGGYRVGFWTLSDGFTNEIASSEDVMNGTLGRGLKTIIWPGLTTNAPKATSFQMGGKRLQVVFPRKIGFLELLSMEDDGKVTGFCKEVFDAAIESLGYDVQYDIFPYKDANGEPQKDYDQIIEAVYFKDYDVAIGDLSITPNRSLYVDFTLPFTDLGLGTLVKVDRNNRWFFLEPFDSDLWIAGVCLFIFMGITVWLIERPINEEFQGSRAQQIGTILWFSVSTLVYAHRERLRCNLSKFVVGIWLFVVFILTSSYTAILSSILTVQQIQSTKGDNIGYQFGSSVRGNVVNNFNWTDSTLRPYLSAEEYRDALLKGNENGGVGAIIDEIPYVKIFLAKYPSDFAMVETSSTTGGFGFAFQKGSPFVSEMSRGISTIRANGKLLELENKWYYSGGKKDFSLLPQDSNETDPKTLNLDNFLFLFFISSLCKILALLILLLFFLRNKFSINKYIFKVFVKLKKKFMKRYPSSRVADSSDVTSPEAL